MSDQTSCIYCGSSTYGRPCLYSPTNTHVHMDEPGKCIYCGSPYRGSGCLFNPYGDVHIMGPEFLSSAALKTEKAAIMTYFFNVASKLLQENTLYKSPLDRVYKRAAAIIASITQPLLETFCLQESPTYGKLSKEELVKTVKYKNKLRSLLHEFSETITEASLELPQEIVENTLVDAIMDINVREN